MKDKGTKITLQRLPSGIPDQSDFRLEKFHIKKLKDAQFLPINMFTVISYEGA